MGTRGLRDGLDPATTQLGSLTPQEQPTLSLIQVPTQSLVPASDGLRQIHTQGHTTDDSRPKLENLHYSDACPK